MSTTVQIDGEERTLADFKAYKAFLALEIIQQAEAAFRALSMEGAKYRSDYAAAHTTVLSRAEARRQFRPQPLLKQEEQEDGTVKIFPALAEDGVTAIVGPDPLGHLTDADWEADDNKLPIPSFPSEEEVQAYLIIKGFEVAREPVLRLLALALTANADLQRWDEDDEDTDAKLDTAAKRLLHQASAGELLKLASSVVQLVKDEISGPLAEIREALKRLDPDEEETPDLDSPPERAPEPMRLEEDEPAADASSGSQTSSTGSEAGTDGTTPPASTEPPGDSA
jgi:hypothetical protein